MGRDMTPREKHKADLAYPQLKHTVLTDRATGKSQPLYDMSSEAMRLYPNLAFLLGEKNMKGLPAGTLSVFERHLTHVINADDAGRQPPRATDEEVMAVMEWYAGRLDPHFYYSSENNRRLVETMANYGEGTL